MRARVLTRVSHIERPDQHIQQQRGQIQEQSQGPTLSSISWSATNLRAFPRVRGSWTVPHCETAFPENPSAF